jgi:hypothetical protein
MFETYHPENFESSLARTLISRPEIGVVFVALDMGIA